MAADGSKRPCSLEEIKDEKANLSAAEKEGVNEGDEGPSVERIKEERNEGAEVKPSKEKPTATADSKPPGDKYSPKVSPRIFSRSNEL